MGVPRALYLSDPEIDKMKEWLRNQGDVIAATLVLGSGDVLGTQIEADTWRRRDEDEQTPESNSIWELRAWRVGFSRRDGKLEFYSRDSWTSRLYVSGGHGAKADAVCWVGMALDRLKVGLKYDKGEVVYLDRTLLTKAVHTLRKQSRRDRQAEAGQAYIHKSTFELEGACQRKYLEEQQVIYLRDGGAFEFWEDHAKTLLKAVFDTDPLAQWLDAMRKAGVSPAGKQWREIRKLALEIDGTLGTACPPFPEEYRLPQGCPWAVG